MYFLIYSHDQPNIGAGIWRRLVGTHTRFDYIPLSLASNVPFVKLIHHILLNLTFSDWDPVRFCKLG